MDRLISEQAILQAIKEPIKKMNCRMSNTELLKNVEQAIKAIPPTEPKYCDRNICLRNEYNNIGCDECEVKYE